MAIIAAVLLTKLWGSLEHRSTKSTLATVEINTNNRLAQALDKIAALEAEVSRLTGLLAPRLTSKRKSV